MFGDHTHAKAALTVSRPVPSFKGVGGVSSP